MASEQVENRGWAGRLEGGSGAGHRTLLKDREERGKVKAESPTSGGLGARCR